MTVVEKIFLAMLRTCSLVMEVFSVVRALTKSLRASGHLGEDLLSELRTVPVFAVATYMVRRWEFLVLCSSSMGALVMVAMCILLNITWTMILFFHAETDECSREVRVRRINRTMLRVVR